MYYYIGISLANSLDKFHLIFFSSSSCCFFSSFFCNFNSFSIIFHFYFGNSDEKATKKNPFFSGLLRFYLCYLSCWFKFIQQKVFKKKNEKTHMHIQKHTHVFKRSVRFRATITLVFQAHIIFSSFLRRFL